MRKSLGIFAFLVTASFFLYEFVARVVPSLASDQIAHDFHLGHAGFGTLSSLFFWVYAPMQIVVGLLLDRFKVRRLIVPSIAICATGVLLFAYAPNAFVAGAGRLATGLGASFGFVGALYVVNHWFPADRFALLSGAVNAVGMIGTAIGAVGLTALIEVTGWRHAFLYIAVAGFVVFLAALFLLRDPPDDGAAVKNAAIAGALRDAIATPRVWLIAIVGALYYMPINVFGALWGNAELVADHNLDAVGAETVVAMLFWGMAAGSIGAGWLSDRLGHRKWLVIGGALLMAAAFSVAIYAPVETEWLLAALLFLGGVFGGGQMLTFAMAKEGHPSVVAGTVIAFVNMVGIGGALLFQPLIGGIVDMEHGRFAMAMSTIPGCLIAAALLGCLIGEERHPDHL